MPPIHEVMTTYFEGEKNAGLFLAGIGLAVLGGAAGLFPAGRELRSFVVVLAIFGVLELAVGVGLYLKTGPQVARLVSMLDVDGASFFAQEQPRMVTVQRNFVILESVWLFLIASAAAVAIWQKQRVDIGGIALGILINTAIFLAFDIIAERRGSHYRAALTTARAM